MKWTDNGRAIEGTVEEYKALYAEAINPRFEEVIADTFITTAKIPVCKRAGKTHSGRWVIVRNTATGYEKEYPTILEASKVVGISKDKLSHELIDHGGVYTFLDHEIRYYHPETTLKLGL